MQYAFLAKFVRFLKENPSAWFILAFQALLVACAIMLAFGLGFLADGVAVVAYVALAAGVVWQLIWFLRHGANSE